MTKYSYMIFEPLSVKEPGALRADLEKIASCGYEGVELNLLHPTAVALDTLESWLRDLDLVIPSFLTGAAYRDGCCMSSKDSGARRRAVEHLFDCLETAARFGAILVVGLLQGQRSDESDTQTANRRIADCLREVGTRAVDAGVRVVIEPINHLQVGFNHSVAEVRSLVSEVGSTAVRPMADTIHMNIEEKSVVQPILDCGAELGHVHLCESNGALLGSGHIDFRAVMKALDAVEYEGFASVKDYRSPDLASSARICLEFLRNLESN
jgi:sugar phosphate isomerase/epimerase